MSLISPPPLGLIQRQGYENIKNKERIRNIIDAMKRFNDAGKKIPTEWVDELRDRLLIDEGA